MSCLFVFTGLLLVVQFGPSVFGIKQIRSVVGDYTVFNIESNSDRSLSHCTIKHNNGTVYGTYPKMHLAHGEHLGRYYECSLRLREITFDQAGLWEISQYRKSENDTPENVPTVFDFELTVYEEESTSRNPITISIYEGNYLTVFIKDPFNDDANCTLTNPNDEVFNLTSTVEIKGIELYQKCGVRMQVNKTSDSDSSLWLLRQSAGPNKLKKLYFNIELADKENTLTQSSEWWEHGSEQKLELKAKKTHYCELKRPDGQIIHLQYPFQYKIHRVTERDAGVWQMRYTIAHDINFSVHLYNITVVDPHAITVSVMPTWDQKINMLCETKMRAIDYCIFTMPNGSLINVLTDIGSFKYGYFGAGTDPETSGKFAECGLTIRNASTEDYGLWKCTVGHEHKIISALVRTQKLYEKKIQSPTINKSSVYVKRGDKFTMKCTTDVALQYCWLQSPNGTIYSVTKDGNSSNSLQYVGDGLATGVCGANVENADDTHAGDWSCRLGVVGSAEIESIVPVTVTDSYIIPIQSNVSIASDPPELTCQLLPGKIENIQYCRWVRPNGHGIYIENSAQYLHKQSPKKCTLHINEWSSEDIGTWRCYARIATNSDEEIFTTIEVLPRARTLTTISMSSNLMLNIFEICLLIVGLIGACVLGSIYYRRRMARIALSKHQAPPAYNNEYDFNDSKGIYPSVPGSVIISSNFCPSGKGQ